MTDPRDLDADVLVIPDPVPWNDEPPPPDDENSPQEAREGRAARFRARGRPRD